MKPPFGMHFAAMTAGPREYTAPPPPMELSAPDSGWIRWRVGDGEAAATIRLSYVFSPLVDIWVWAAAIAHRLLPVTLRIDEEGVYTDLHADWSDQGRDLLRLVVRQTDADEQEYRRLAWREDRTGWLARLASQFGAYLGDGFDTRSWHLGAIWPEPACRLPWVWPVWVAPHTACDWPMTSRRAWFFLNLAYLLDPIATGWAWRRDDDETLAKLRFMFVFESLSALDAAWACLLDTAFPDTGKVEHSLALARDLFDEIEFMHEGGEVDAELADAAARDNRLRAAVRAFETDFHFLREQVITALMSWFPLRAGQWLVDESLRHGRIVQVEGKRRVVDWGKFGISTERGFRQGYRTLWRWPISRPSASLQATDAMHRRWAAFATSARTAQLCICPCCGYPHLDEEPEEIMACPLCGWPLYLTLSRPLPDPEEPVLDESSGDLETWPPLSASRRFFTAYGDAFPANDTAHTRWLRRPDVAGLRRQVMAEFDTWLADPERGEKPLPEESWRQLDHLFRGR
jgi:hypothetical protein